MDRIVPLPSGPLESKGCMIVLGMDQYGVKIYIILGTLFKKENTKFTNQKIVRQANPYAYEVLYVD